MDAFATYNYVEIEASPTISVVAGPPVRYKAVLPSLSLAGQPLRLGFKGEDKWGNPSDQAQSRYTLRSNLRMARMPESFEMAKTTRCIRSSRRSMNCMRCNAVIARRAS